MSFLLFQCFDKATKVLACNSRKPRSRIQLSDNTKRTTKISKEGVFHNSIKNGTFDLPYLTASDSRNQTRTAETTFEEINYREFNSHSGRFEWYHETFLFVISFTRITRALRKTSSMHL